MEKFKAYTDPFLYIDESVNESEDDMEYDDVDYNTFACNAGIITTQDIISSVTEIESDYEESPLEIKKEDKRYKYPKLSDYFNNEFVKYYDKKRIKTAFSKSVKNDINIPELEDFKGVRSYGLAKYLIDVGLCFVNIHNLPYIYCTENGTYYCLITQMGKKILLNALPTQILQQVDVKNVFRILDVLPALIDDDRSNMLNEHRSLINFADGVYDILSGEVLQHSPEYTFLSCINASVQDIFAEDSNDLFQQYIDNSFGDDYDNVSNLQEMVGIALSTIRDQKMAFFLYGCSNSGKSVILNLLQMLLGSEFCSSLSFAQITQRFSTSQLLGKTLNTCGEIPELTSNRLDVFKSIVGNDPFSAEYKGKDSFDMINQALLVFGCNDMPQISTPDDAYYNRIRIIRYTRSIERSLWIQNLTERLYKESRSSVIKFAIEGLRRFIANDMELTCIQTSDAYVSEYRNDANSFLSFINNFIESSPGEILLSSELFKAYTDYCKRNRIEKPIGTNKCSQILTSTFKTEKTTYGKKSDRCYKNLRCRYFDNSDM